MQFLEPLLKGKKANGDKFFWNFSSDHLSTSKSKGLEKSFGLLLFP